MNQQKNCPNLLDFAEALLDDSRQVSIRMNGNSMFPTLKAGDVGTVEKCGVETLQVGDIVVFKSSGNLVAHRLVNITKTFDGIQFVTKGDHNSHMDTPFSADAILGKLSSYTRGKKIISVDSFRMKYLRYLSQHFSRFVIPLGSLRLLINHHSNQLVKSFVSIKDNLQFICKQSGNDLFANIVISILQGILPFLLIVCIKLLIDFLTQARGVSISENWSLIGWLIITALVFLINGVLSDIRGYYFEKLSQSISHRIYKKLHHKHDELDLSYYENPTEQDKIHRAVQEATFRPIKIVGEVLTFIKSIASALFLLVVFVAIKWYLVVMLFVAVVPGVLVRLKSSRKLYKLKATQSTKEREMYYFNRVLTGFPFAKEMKLFGFSQFFLKRFSSAQQLLFDQKLELRRSELWLNISAQLFAIVLIFVSLVYVSYLKVSGVISIGTVVLFFFAFQRGYTVLNEFFRSITQILEDNIFLNDFIEFLHLPSKSDQKPIPTLPFSLKKEIRFEHVSFHYETSKRDALSAVDIVIPAGKTVAFVGANGSGKTTLIKLLCGFYPPSAGNILIDGVNVSQIGQAVIRENITAVFQDFALYNVSAASNIGLGDVSSDFDIERARKAARAAGIEDVLAKLPNGFHSLLGNLFVGGEELSIGQWQKLAIARAFYRNSPLLLMDEPSSALDANSELQIIDSLKELSKDKTAVIISHRLSTVKWADIIYLFHEGSVVESGSHNELLALGGKYFELYQVANSR